jgi:hypothetical protein
MDQSSERKGLVYAATLGSYPHHVPGLSIKSRIVGLYGGNIHVESEPDKGNIFILILSPS